MDPTSAKDREALLPWLALKLAQGVGSVRFQRLLERFGSPRAALAAPVAGLMRCGLPRDVAGGLASGKTKNDAADELDQLAAMGAQVLTTGEEAYPPLLKKIYAPPPLLYVLGDAAPLRPGGVAVVGSRNYSRYGQRMASELGRDLARAGVSVVSGLARGIDTFAQAGALNADGHTVAVLGCGLDIFYPRENAALAQRIARQGAVISEFPLGTGPNRSNFPIRNRVISGLSRAVVVVEGGMRSGSLITARHALDQGREVFAIPGNVGIPQSEGTNDLICQGARLCRSAADVLEPGALAPLPPEALPLPPPELPDEAKVLLELITQEAVHADVLVRQSGLAPQEVSALLVNLDLAGVVTALPGRYYVRE